MGIDTRVIAFAGVLALAACATHAPRTSSTIYSDDGVSELTAPDSWRTRPNLGRSGTIRLSDDAGGHYLIVNSYHPHEKDGSSVEDFAERVSRRLMNRLADGRISPPRQFSVNGRPAMEYEVSGKAGDLPLAYTSTVVEGEYARHHLIAWTPAERNRANREGLREVAASFRESAQRRPEKKRTDLTFDWPERMTSTATVRSKSNKRGEVMEMQARAVTTVRPLGEDQLLVSSKIAERRVMPAIKDKDKANYL